MLMTDAQYAQLLSHWLDEKDRTEILKVQLQHYKELTKFNKSDLQFIILVYIQDLKGITRRMWQIKPLKHFSYPRYYMYISELRIKVNGMRDNVMFLMNQCKEFPAVVNIVE